MQSDRKILEAVKESKGQNHIAKTKENYAKVHKSFQIFDYL